jgi:hypothetical protein
MIQSISKYKFLLGISFIIIVYDLFERSAVIELIFPSHITWATCGGRLHPIGSRSHESFISYWMRSDAVDFVIQLHKLLWVDYPWPPFM